MRTKILVAILIYLPVFYLSESEARAQDSLRFFCNVAYQEDLSDTFGGGALLAGDFVLFKSWYGVGVTYGSFQSHSSTSYVIAIEDVNSSFNIPIDELSIMKIGSFSGLVTPIRVNRFQSDFLFGFVYGHSKEMCFKSLTYTYNYSENILTSVEKDYQLVERTHIGYQIGINATYYFLKNIGLQLNSRIMDLNNGGSFIFFGGGLSFQI